MQLRYEIRDKDLKVNYVKGTDGQIESASLGPAPLSISYYLDKLEINANEERVKINGDVTMMNDDDLDELHRVIKWALRQKQSLEMWGILIDQETLVTELQA